MHRLFCFLYHPDDSDMKLKWDHRHNIMLGAMVALGTGNQTAVVPLPGSHAARRAYGKRLQSTHLVRGLPLCSHPGWGVSLQLIFWVMFSSNQVERASAEDSDMGWKLMRESTGVRSHSSIVNNWLYDFRSFMQAPRASVSSFVKTGTMKNVIMFLMDFY